LTLENLKYLYSLEVSISLGSKLIEKIEKQMKEEDVVTVARGRSILKVLERGQRRRSPESWLCEVIDLFRLKPVEAAGTD
jgi:DNA-binding transcriptional regulator LsrR (DeoR family)